jgi:hypothetical protein
MFCFVDFRNRPQYKYTFHSREKAREYLRKIQNNSLGATIIHADGRREYFASGVPANLLKSQSKFRIRRGCHVKYSIRPLAVLDGIAPKAKKEKSSNISNWKSRLSSPLFMIGNLKFSACLLIISLTAFSFAYIFQKNFGRSAAYEGLKNSGRIALGATDDRTDNIAQSAEDSSLQLADEDIVMNLIARIDDEKNMDFAKEILPYVKGKPMEDMAPFIAKQPRIVAAFIVGIAMKESKFGVYAPHDASGNDCHNYWGYRGPENTTESGYSCFATPEIAIQVIGKKINKLVAGGISNPAEMISWKCGSSCAGHGAENVRKWIADVGVNFYKLNTKQSS